MTKFKGGQKKEKKRIYHNNRYNSNIRYNIIELNKI